MKGQHLEVVVNRRDQQRKVRYLGRREHTLILEMKEKANCDAQAVA